MCSLHKRAWGSPLYQSPSEAKEQDSPHPHLHGPLSNPEGVKARINQRIARGVRRFEGDEQGQRGELLRQSSQEGLSEEAAFYLRPKGKKEASHVRRGRTLQEKKSSSSPGGGGFGCPEGLSHSKQVRGPGEVRGWAMGAMGWRVYNLGNNCSVLSRGVPHTRDQQIPPNTGFYK